MKLVPADPFFPNSRVFNSFDRLFDTFFDRALSEVRQQGLSHFNVPSVNIVENDKDFVLEVAAPGLNREDFHVSVEDKQLVIEAKQARQSEDKAAGQYTRREFNYAAFKRSFALPDTVDAANIGARYEQGILYVTLPKLAPAAPEDKVRRISIA